MVCDVAHNAEIDLQKGVLILILLEYGLRQTTKVICVRIFTRLNPYSTGIWSATDLEAHKNIVTHVLILILLEYGLRHELLPATGYYKVS